MDPLNTPGHRTDRLADSPEVSFCWSDGFGVADTPRCRQTNWGHRLVSASPSWEIGLAECFARWADHHAGKGVQQAHVCFEALSPDAPATLSAPGAALEVLTTSRLEQLASFDTPLPVRLLSGERDAAQLVNLDMQVHGWGDAPDALEYVRWSRASRRAVFEGGGGEHLGAFDGDRLVGAAALHWDAHEARYQEVAVHPEVRGRGVATSLVGTLAARAGNRGGPLWINATAGSQAARIYERLGFVPVSTMWSWSMKAPLPVAEIEARWAALQTAELPLSKWGHADHLWGAVCVLRDCGGDLGRAVNRLRGILVALLAANGVQTTADQGYHETLTRGFLSVIAAQRRENPADPFALAVIRAQLAFADKRYLLRHWSRPTMTSAGARAGWVPPDLEPLPEG